LITPDVGRQHVNRTVKRAALALATIFALVVAGSSPAAASQTTKQTRGKIIITRELVWIGPGTTPDGPVPYAGVAVAGIPGWDEVLWATKYKCTYLDWDPLSVNWRCELWNYGTPNNHITFQSHTGTFSNGSLDTPTYYYFGVGSCVYAEAHYSSYTSESDHSSRCG
jgi:hypothetical protein